MPHISETTARRLVETVKANVDDIREAVTALYDGQGWLALGYESWDALCDAEFAVRLSLPRTERREVVAGLADAGMSDRAISGALGVPRTTVQRDRQVAQSGPRPEPVNRETGEIGDGLDEFHPATTHNPQTSGAVESPSGSASPATPAPEPRPIRGRDGKTYTRPTPKPDPERERQREALAEIMQPDPATEYRRNLLRAISNAQPLVRFEPSRIVEVADENALFLIEAFASDVAKWAAAVKSTGRGLRVVKG